MNWTLEQAPVLPIIVPFLVAFSLPLIGLFVPRFVRPMVLVAGLVTTILCVFAAATGWHAPTVLSLGGWSPLLGVTLVVDKLSAVFLIISGLGALTTLGFSLVERFQGDSWRFYVLFFIMFSAMNAMIVTADLFNLYVFMEIYSVTAYILVALGRTKDSVEAGLKYLLFGSVGAMFILLGVAYTYMATGLLNMALVAEVIHAIPRETTTVMAATLLFGFAIKMGAFPLHFWLPDAHSSAHFVLSALLSGVLIKISVYVIIRLSFTVFAGAHSNLFSVILVIGCLSILAGHLMALQQSDIKRLLAYSTVAQMGYILLGIGLGTAMGVSGAVYHAANHMVFKMTLFLSAGILMRTMGTRKIDQFKGAFHRSPVLVCVFTLAAAAIVGIPVLNGFMSKWLLTVASMQTDMMVPALVIAAGTCISAYYYLRILKRMFSPAASHTEQERALQPQGNGSTSRVGMVMLLSLALLCVVMGMIPFVGPWWEMLMDVGRQTAEPSLYLEAVKGL